jgi:hypothetical protein
MHWPPPLAVVFHRLKGQKVDLVAMHSQFGYHPVLGPVENVGRDQIISPRNGVAHYREDLYRILGMATRARHEHPLTQKFFSIHADVIG